MIREMNGRTMIDLKNIETFYVVSTLGSFRNAAQKLHATQPAISQRIAQLEESFGCRLLRREGRSVTPTPQGRELLIYAEKMLALRAEMIAAISTDISPRGVLRIGAAETIVHSWLPQFIEHVNRVYPRLALEIEVDISPNLRDRLISQEIDLAFLMEPFAGDPLVHLPLCRHVQSFIANPAVAGSLPHAPASIEELAAFPIMTFSRRTKPYEAVKQLFSRPNLPRVRLHASASLATLIHMAEEGLGIAVIPASIIRDRLAQGRLRRIRTDVRVPDIAFVAAWMPAPDMQAPSQVARIAQEIARSTPVE